MDIKLKVHVLHEAAQSEESAFISKQCQIVPSYAPSITTCKTLQDLTSVETHKQEAKYIHDF